MPRPSARFDSTLVSSHMRGRRARRKGCVALLVIDNAPLQAGAWSELLRARKRMEKATQQIHRHEQVDTPAFQAWLGATFPEQMACIREMLQQVAAKSQLVDTVEHEAWITGRSARRVWQAWKSREARASSPHGDQDSTPPEGGTGAHDDDDISGMRREFDEPGVHDDRDGGSGPDDFDTMFDEFCSAQGLDTDDPFAEEMRNMAAHLFGIGQSHRRPEPAPDVRATYRRLAQRLHPDSGGAWTPERERLWHQVQEAWAARDGDWLARLEADYDIAAETLGPTSPVGRLRAALAELFAGRRDADRRLRVYRETPAWRFSAAPADPRRRRRVQSDLEFQLRSLHMQLEELESIIAHWERPPRKTGKMKRTRAARANAQRELVFC